MTINGDCLEEMTKIPDGSVDMILTDLPYAVTAYSWDSIIDFDELWVHWNRILKPDGAVVLFASGRFVHTVMGSNLKNYKYMWTWVKSCATNFANAKKMPMRKTEQILVFYRKQCTYNPQGLRRCEDGSTLGFNHGNIKESGNGVSPEGKLMSSGFKERCDGVSSQTSSGQPARRRNGSKNSLHLGNGVDPNSSDNFYYQEYTGYPTDVLEFPKKTGKRDWDNFHPTQKPVDLLRYLIRTYTDPGEVVLDCTAGSMSTAVAALYERRDCISIEKNPEYHSAGVERLERHQNIIKSRLF